jgi:hypothetical protein
MKWIPSYFSTFRIVRAKGSCVQVNFLKSLKHCDSHEIARPKEGYFLEELHTPRFRASEMSSLSSLK